ncbi:MAG: PorV/PorQ family protein [Bacteroidia bacterium]|nr:PorV/PorQ family protein [Bacteroidia bacterium]
MKQYILLACVTVLFTGTAWAQSERTGQAGATQLLINSMPKSSGFNGTDVASTEGIESGQLNPAGIARTEGTELLFAHTRWLRPSDIGINSFGFSQAIGRNGAALGVNVNAFSLGEFIRTTTDLPDGTLGSFSPTFLNIGISYAKKFTDHIYVGTTARIISESTPEVSASGIAFDAGIQYRTGKKDRLRLGIALKNVGPTMRYGGDGLTFRVQVEPDNDFTSSSAIPTARFELPAVLNMGAAYDFLLGNHNTVTVNGAFIANSFYLNQGGVGLAYNYHDVLILRYGFLYEQGIFGKVIGVDGRYNVHTGHAAGGTVQIPFKTGRVNSAGDPAFSTVSLDFSYRTSNPFSGTFVFGGRINI